MRRRRLGKEARQRLDDGYTRLNLQLSRAQGQVFRFLWLFLPEPSVARKLRFQHMVASRFLSEAGQQSVMYGALVAVARGGGSALELALVGVAALVPGAALGLYGGAVADALPKRVALAMVYALQAALCFIVAITAATHLGEMLLLIFAVNALGQVSGPTESSMLPLLASKEELASAASLVNLAAAFGAAFGAALLAPVLVRAVGVEEVLYVAGALLLLAASRVFILPRGEGRRRATWAVPQVQVRGAVEWLARYPAVATMMVVAVVGGTANTVVQTLAPRYVVSVLHTDAADTAYVFAPSAAGLVLALVAAPSLMRAFGERMAALAGFFVAAACLMLLGLVGEVVPVLDPVNPIGVLSVVGIDLNERLRTASLLAMPLGFGIALTATSVQTYLNRRVPLSYQARTFAMQAALRSGAAIVPLVALGVAASAFGVEKVLIASPVVLVLVAVALVELSFRFGGRARTTQLEVLESFWEETGGEIKA